MIFLLGTIKGETSVERSIHVYMLEGLVPSLGGYGCCYKHYHDSMIRVAAAFLRSTPQYSHSTVGL